MTTLQLVVVAAGCVALAEPEYTEQDPCGLVLLTGQKLMPACRAFKNAILRDARVGEFEVA